MAHDSLSLSGMLSSLNMRSKYCGRGVPCASDSNTGVRALETIGMHKSAVIAARRMGMGIYLAKVQNFSLLSQHSLSKWMP